MNLKLKKAFEIAQGELGVKEFLDDKQNPRILEYHATTSLKAKTDETPWCSSFVNYCVTKAGLTGTNSASARSWLKWGQPSEVNHEGDIVILKRGKDGISGHVGFFLCFDGPYVWVLGGNQSDSVCKQKFMIHSILDIRTQD